MTIQRTTYFKATNKDDIDTMIGAMKNLKQDCKKDSKNYIQALSVGKVGDDPRCNGYSVALSLTFNSVEDMKYYDDEEPAHGALKATLKGKVGGPPMVIYFEEVTSA